MSQPIFELVERTRHHYFPDPRLDLNQIDVDQQPDRVSVRGAVLDRQAADGFMQALRIHAPGVNWRDEMTPLVSGPDYHWALINRAVADVRSEPRNDAERVTQTLFGEAVEVLRRQDTWAFVRLPDGYLGWMHVEPLLRTTAEAVEHYTQHATHLVRHAWSPCFAHPSGDRREQSALLPFGVRVIAEAHEGAMQRIRWPDGTVRWVPSVDLIPQAEWQHNVDGLRAVVMCLQALVGVPYLWGGRTAFGIDCSGLTQLAYNAIGLRLRRDADQQAAMGSPVPLDAIEFGDLLFFATGDSTADSASAPSSEITHVALALNRTEFIHSTWRGGGVVYGSFDPQSPVFAASYHHRFWGARRYLRA
jgi:gamma-D-glutamyl-L-lysine dipeptidyl-peptidase